MGKQPKLTLALLTGMLCVLMLAMPAFANSFTFSVIPGIYDPGHTGFVKAAWLRQQGLPDSKGHANYGLFLSKIGPTSTNAASGANLRGVHGISVTELGFAVRTDGHCGAGAPRFNVTTSDNVTHFAGCAAATVTGTATDSQGRLWNIVRIDPTNATQMYPVIAPGTKVKNIQIVFDEGTDVGSGYTYLDNIDVNSTTVGMPTS